MTSENIKDISFPLFEKHKDHLLFGCLFGSATQDDMSTLNDVDFAVFLYKRN